MAPVTQTALAVVSCIVAAGFIGGFINYLGQNKPKDGDSKVEENGQASGPDGSDRGSGPATNTARPPAAYYVLLSTAAAITVPVLLYIIQSKISDSLFKVDLSTDLQTWFVFFGLCVLAAVFAQRYLEAVYAKLLQEINQTKNTANKALGTAGKAEENSIKAKGVVEDFRLNQPIKSETQASLASPPTAPSSLSPIQKKIFEALNDPAYSLKRRTLGGIMNDAALDQRTALSNLDQMKKENLVKEEAGGRTGTVYYRWIGSPSAT